MVYFQVKKNHEIVCKTENFEEVKHFFERLNIIIGDCNAFKVINNYGYKIFIKSDKINKNKIIRLKDCIDKKQKTVMRKQKNRGHALKAHSIII